MRMAIIVRGHRRIEAFNARVHDGSRPGREGIVNLCTRKSSRPSAGPAGPAARQRGSAAARGAAMDAGELAAAEQRLQELLDATLDEVGEEEELERKRAKKVSARVRERAHPGAASCMGGVHACAPHARRTRRPARAHAPARPAGVSRGERHLQCKVDQGRAAHPGCAACAMRSAGAAQSRESV